ncbi:unnamed protein product [Musa textilis]
MRCIRDESKSKRLPPLSSAFPSPPPLPCPSMAESRMVELSSPTTNLQEPRDPLCSLLSETE